MIERFIIRLFTRSFKSSSRKAHRRSAVSRKPHYSLPAEKRKALSEEEIAACVESLPRYDVQWVVDGDTAIISNRGYKTKVRLDSIDCPEDGQHWGDTAKYGLVKLIGGRRVHVEEHGTDSFGRMLVTIYVQHEFRGPWINVNERMVTLGHAWVMRRFYDHLPKDRQDRLNGLERWARSKKIGLWGTENPVPPWEWRKEC